jgi:hypothetical protein
MFATKALSLVFASLLALALCACGAGAPLAPAAPGGTATETPVNPEADKAASATFRYFFQDVVSASSHTRWSVENSSGQKSFILSNTAHSAPKAWVIGQNYWNRENDSLTSEVIEIPAEKPSGIKLAFYSRWQIEPNDMAKVEYQIDGGEWVLLEEFWGGQNPAYPAWTRYWYNLPGSSMEAGYDLRLRFSFQSNTSVTGWGFGVDSISVYQTKMSPPSNVQASDGDPSGLTLTWEPPIDGPEPWTYEIWRATSPEGPYEYAWATNAETFTWTDWDAEFGTIYYYRLRSIREDGYEIGNYSPPEAGDLGNPV